MAIFIDGRICQKEIFARQTQIFSILCGTFLGQPLFISLTVHVFNIDKMARQADDMEMWFASKRYMQHSWCAGTAMQRLRIVFVLLDLYLFFFVFFSFIFFLFYINLLKKKYSFKASVSSLWLTVGFLHVLELTHAITNQ